MKNIVGILVFGGFAMMLPFESTLVKAAIGAVVWTVVAWVWSSIMGSPDSEDD